MKKPRKIVVEAIIPAPVEVVWERTQTPDLHTLWDIRFTHITYLDEQDACGFNLMDYRTDVVFGIEVAGIGRYLQNAPPHHSTFEFESADWKSIITLGRGIWQYEPCIEGTYFKTVYDYGVRYGVLGRLLDALVFRNLLRLSTEWGFETLRQWCAADESVVAKRRSRWRFMKFFLARLLGRKPAKGAARSWLGSGQETELRDKNSSEYVHGSKH
ncbi:MAG: hypothetical protein AB1757_30145 [Acidobacteriota bacterium]